LFITKLKRALDKKAATKIFDNTILSNRELDTLKLIANQKSNQEIADQLFISLNTVKTHLKNLFVKLEVDSRISAVSKAKELGLL
jgi:LuxR family maltose regulon positive regulatory protein